MHRKLVVSAVCLAVFAASAGDCFARGRLFRSRPAASSVFNRGGGGPLARLNKPLIPTMPGLPTVSPLGLIAPRMSNAVSIFQFGGFSTQAGRLAGGRSDFGDDFEDVEVVGDVERDFGPVGDELGDEADGDFVDVVG